MDKYIKLKVVDFVNHFGFTKEDIENEVDFAYEAESKADETDADYYAYYSLCDEVKNYYHVNNINAIINELVTDYLTKL